MRKHAAKAMSVRNRHDDEAYAARKRNARSPCEERGAHGAARNVGPCRLITARANSGKCSTRRSSRRVSLLIVRNGRLELEGVR